MAQIMRAIILALLLLLPATAHAQFAKPLGVPTYVVPDYNIEITVFASHNDMLGDRVAAYNLQSGQWFGIPGAATPFYTNLPAVIAAAGGEDAFIRQTVLPAINAGLAVAFPPMNFGGPAPPPGNPVATINFLLGTGYTIRTQNGLPTLAPK